MRKGAGARAEECVVNQIEAAAYIKAGYKEVVVKEAKTVVDDSAE